MPVRSCPPEMSDTVVRSPVNAKKSGSRSTIIRSRSRDDSASASGPDGGSSAPTRKAPNSAWIPSRSVTHADVSASSITIASCVCAELPGRAARSATRASNGRTSVNMTAR